MDSIVALIASEKLRSSQKQLLLFTQQKIRMLRKRKQKCHIFSIPFHSLFILI